MVCPLYRDCPLLRDSNRIILIGGIKFGDLVLSIVERYLIQCPLFGVSFMRDSTVHTYIHYMNCSSQLLLNDNFFLMIQLILFIRYISRRMREADKKYIFLSVVGVYVVRTSSLNKHSCQLFRKAASFSSLVLLSSSVSMANLSCLLATTFSSLRFLFNFTSLQSFESGQALFLVVIYFLIFTSYPQSSAFLSSVLQAV